MKSRNLKIGTLLSIGLSIILILFIMLMLATYHQSNRLWNLTANLYNHPMQVSTASRDIKIDYYAMHLELKNIALDDNLTPSELDEDVKLVNTLETRAYNSFAILYKCYLGPKTDIDSAYNEFKNWKNLRDDVIEQRKNNNLAEAYHLYTVRNKTAREKMFAKLQVIINYSTVRAGIFYKEAEQKKNSLISWLRLAFTGMFLISILIIYLIFRNIRTPLKELTRVTESYKNGNYHVRSSYVATNEIGKLAATFNEMAESVQKELSMKNNTAELARLLLREYELKPFCRALLNALVSYTNSQVAAIYFLNKEKSQYEHFDSIGLQAENFKSFSAASHEGEFGAVLAQKKIVRIAQIPDDTRFKLHTVTGVFRPRDIITIPIFSDQEIEAVISLASLSDFTPASLQLIEEMQYILSARISGILAFRKITDISLRLDQQNQQLADKSRELSMQADELKEYNIELKLQKKEVEDANHVKSSFLMNMSHELRTPLNSVIALSGVLSRKLKGAIPADEYNYLQIIGKNGNQLLMLINDILDLSRIESGREELDISTFSIYILVQSLVETLNPIASEKNILLLNKVPELLPDVSSDQDKCQHILQNILSNAVKFTSEGSVAIDARKVNNEIHISVSDTGIGIEREYLPLIFDEFRQADDKISRKFGGTGLGLAIAKKYIQMLDGSIDVESTPGQGSTFTVKLPVSIASAREEKKEPKADAGKIPSYVTTEKEIRSGHGKTILVVEDSEAQILQLSYILSRNGYNVRIARNGKDALEEIAVSIPDAMILDLMMPEVDGFEVLASVRAQKETSQIPVLILTAKHVTKNELYFLKGNNVHQIITKGDVNRTELLSEIYYMTNPVTETTSAPVDYIRPGEDKPLIVVVEDNSDNLETVKALLSDKYLIAGTADASDGLIKIRALNPALILLDISLPGMDGFSMFDEIRKDEKLRHIPVVALTARAMKGDKEELLSYGFNGYISKPINSETMESTINDLLNGK